MAKQPKNIRVIPTHNNLQDPMVMNRLVRLLIAQAQVELNERKAQQAQKQPNS